MSEPAAPDDAAPDDRVKRSRRIVAVVAAAVAVVLIAAVAIAVSLGSQGPGPAAGPSGSAAPSGTAAPTETAGPSSTPSPAECGEPTVTVSTAQELEAAIDNPQPGTVVSVQPGTYRGEFVATGQGTTEAPIQLCGSPDAVLDGGGTSGGYVLHLDGVTHWLVSGFTVRNGQKGVMADGATNTRIENLTVTDIGDEGIHLRDFSTDNVVAANTIRNTGLRKPKFGEGIYVGTAESNWCDVSDCAPDASDRNTIEGNDIAATTSESVDLKEGTSDGVLRENTFDGSSITAADSWVDVKGNDWVIESNVGTHSPLDGYQVHEIVDGWGTGNVFRDNTATVNGPGFGYSLTPELDNVVECSNTAS
ncbi:MAG: hypothetical protein JWM51_1140, partial [Microbacteriaceae bacterium]|nr:hypothetical protein [Microbacteriaceae bacterium]